MPHLSRVEAGTMVNPAVHHHPSAHAHPQVQVEAVVHLPPPQNVEAVGGGVGLVLHHQGKIPQAQPRQGRPNPLPQGEVLPAQVGGQGQVAVPGLQKPGHGHGRRQDTLPRKKGAGGLGQPA